MLRAHAEHRRRPAGGRERDRAAWRFALAPDRDADRDRRSPRQGLPVWTRAACPTTRSSAAPTCCASATRAAASPDLILIATGSEVHLVQRAPPTLLEADGHRDAARVDAVHGPLRRAGPGLPRPACCRRRCARAWRSRRRARSAGTAGPATRRRGDRHDDLRRVSAPRRTSSSTSASRRSAWPRRGARGRRDARVAWRRSRCQRAAGRAHGGRAPASGSTRSAAA